VLAEIRALVRGRQRRTREQILSEYRDWRVDLDQPVLALHPDGRLERTRAIHVRQRNWQRIVAALRDDLGVAVGTVLEVGGGDGTNRRHLAQLAPDLRWLACDLIPRSADVQYGDATALPFASRSVDAVVTYNALEQMPREVSARAMQEIARVSRHGLVSIEPDYQRGGWSQKLAMTRKDYIRDVVGPATAAGLRLLRREWTIGGNPMNRPAIFVFTNN
jgi:SAM-dependent methyltransferase